MIKLDNILVAIDLSSVSEGAAAFAPQLASKTGGQLHVLSVDVAAQSTPRDGDDTEVEKSERFRLHQERLMEKTSSDSKLQVIHKTVQDSAPAAGIVHYAEENDIDLIVTGTHGRRGVQRMIKGSVAADVVRGAPCPVLTVRTGEGNPPQSVRKIAVPIDFSEPTKGAMKYAAALANLFDAKLSVIHVWDAAKQDESSGIRPSALGAVEGYKRAQERVKALCNELSIDAHVSVLDGRPAPEITEYAVKQAVDLIVMPTRGTAGLQRLWVGSVAEDIITTGPCPVLSAKSFDRFVQMEGVA